MGSDIEKGRWLALRRAGLGSKNFALLIKHFGELAPVWSAPPDELRRAGLTGVYLRAVLRARASFDPEEEIGKTGAAGARVLTWGDEGYPPLLREIPESPPLLVVRGRGDPAPGLAVAVVGTRRVTPYGRRLAEDFCRRLAGAGVAIVSGLARGVDGIAHRIALEEGVPTIAVLAGGIDEIYPREHTGLAARIEEGGCVLSEYPLGVRSRPDFFPRRNRILAGLAHVTLVIEAGATSGALHTANWAFEQGRDVFAVPGPVYSAQSEGCHRLIRDHTAALVTGPEEVLAELDVAATGARIPLGEAGEAALVAAPPLAPEDEALVGALAGQERHIDELARELRRPVAELAARLAMLELEGLVRQAGSMVYSAGGAGRGRSRA